MSEDLRISPSQIIERYLSMELVRVTERAAVSAARLRGHGNEKAADQAAVDAMRRELNRLPIDGEIVIGERVGTRQGPKVHIAVDPLEGTTLCAKDMPDSIAVMAMAEAGKLLNAPDVYMDKIAIGPGYARGVVDLDASPTDNIHALAKAKGVKPSEISTLIMDRPRHAKLIEEVRKTGCSIRLITDGDVAGVIYCTEPHKTGIDLYLGIGGAPEGVLAAAALRCVGGQMQGRLILDTEEKRARALTMGITDPNKKYSMEEMASGDTIVCATGVTDGGMLKGVKFGRDVIETETIVYRSITGTVRRIQGEHRDFGKFKLD